MKAIAMLLLVVGCVAAPASAAPIVVHRTLTNAASAQVLTTTAPNACPSGMVLVSGEYCADLDTPCREWIDPPNGIIRRCRLYAETKCIVPTVHREYCMDKTEYTEGHFARLNAMHLIPSVKQTPDVNSRLPLANVDYEQATLICKAEGHRMCKQTEFEQSCEGPAFMPYPTGLERRCDLCNCDRTHNLGRDFEHRVDHRETVDEVAACVSGYGIEGLVGNCDELYTRNHSPGPYVVAMAGGHWLPIRAKCAHSVTLAHGPTYSHITASFRCCADPQ